MLHGEHCRRHEHCRLLRIAGSLERRAHGYLRLAESDIAADKAIHRAGGLHICLYDEYQSEDQLLNVSVSDSLLAAYSVDEEDVFDQPLALPSVVFMPAVYDHYHFFEPLTVSEQVYSGNPAMRWLEDLDVLNRRTLMLKQGLFFNNPELVRYNLASLPEPPAPYVMVVDPSDFSVSVKVQEEAPKDITISVEQVKKKHWIHTFNASQQKQDWTEQLYFQ